MANPYPSRRILRHTGAIILRQYRPRRFLPPLRRPAKSSADLIRPILAADELPGIAAVPGPGQAGIRSRVHYAIGGDQDVIHQVGWEARTRRCRRLFIGSSNDSPMGEIGGGI